MRAASSDFPTTWPGEDEGGFVMVMVVLLLFAVAVAGLTGYQLVQVEADLAGGSEEAHEALAAARAGLERYVGEHLGVPGDTTTYAIGNADVFVVPRRVVANTSTTAPDLYVIEAIAEVSDPRYPSSPARRTVRQSARLHKEPVRVTGAIMSTANEVDVITGFVFGGDRQGIADPPYGYSQRGGAMSPTTGNCSGGNLPIHDRDVFGTVAVTTAGDLPSNPNASDGGEWAGGSPQAIIDTASVAWSVVQDPNFPAPHQWGINWPAFATYPDSFFVARYDGDLTITGNGTFSGQGVLIVTGDLAVAGGSTFLWRGIVLAGGGSALGGLGTGWNNTFAVVRGALVTGLDGGSPSSFLIGGGGSSTVGVENYSCYLSEANRVLAYLELVDGTRWEF